MSKCPPGFTLEDLSKMVNIDLENVGSNNSIWEDMIVQRETYLQFPIVGKPNAVYFEKSTNTVWRWDDSSLKYYCVGANYEDVKYIDANYYPDNE